MDTENPQRPPECRPSTWNEPQLEHSVEFIIGMLEQAARGQHVAWALGNAMSSIANRRGGAINTDQASRLRAAASRAEQGALRELIRYIQPSQIKVGMQALAVQIEIWSVRQDRCNEEYKDAPLHARIFRNSLHNLDLCFQLGERSAQRLAEREARYTAIVAGLLAAGVQDGPADDRGELN